MTEVLISDVLAEYKNKYDALQQEHIIALLTIRALEAKVAALETADDAEDSGANEHPVES